MDLIDTNPAINTNPIPMYNSLFFISTYSTAISYAICHFKPIIHIYSSRFPHPKDDEEGIAKQSSNWNVCYRDSIAWYEKAKPDWSVQDKEVFASNFCNGGIPVRPGPGFQLAPR